MLVFTHGSVAGPDSIQSHLVKTFSKISGWIKLLFNDTVHCAKYFVAAAGLHFTVFDSVLMALLIKLAAKGHMRSYRSSFLLVSQQFFLFFCVLLFISSSEANECKKVCENYSQKAVITWDKRIRIFGHTLF